MAGRSCDGDSFFRNSRRDWISDRASRRDDIDYGSRRYRDRSRGRDDWNRDRYNRDRYDRGSWSSRRSRSPDSRGSSRDRGRRLSSERDGRRNYYRGRDDDSDRSKRRSSDRSSRFDGSLDRERDRNRPVNRDHSPLSDNNDNQSVKDPGPDEGDLDHPSNDNSGFEPTGNTSEQEVAGQRNVDNWGRELRLGGDLGPVRERSCDKSLDTTSMPGRSVDRDWKRSVDDFLCPRGSSPNNRPRSRDRQDPVDNGEWDRDMRRVDRNKYVPSRSGADSRDRVQSPHRKAPQDRQPLDRAMSNDSYARDFGSRNRALPNISPKHNNIQRDQTPIVDEQSDGDDMVISDGDNDSKNNDDEWENMVLMKYKQDSSSNDRYRSSMPQKTVVVRCMPADVSEEDILRNITSCNLVCHDIRLVRSKDTGYSRGFSFVEFYNTEDAASWIEINQGVFKIGKSKCYMEYSVPREQLMMQQGFTPSRHVSDWICTKCKAHNFSKRFLCYICNSSRTFSEAEEWSVQTSDHPTSTVVLIGLDVLTSEETILKSIAILSQLPIRSVKVARDPLTNISKGACYLEMNNALDAYNLFNKLKVTVPEIDGRRPEVKFAKPASLTGPTNWTKPIGATGKIGNTAIAAAQWSHQSHEKAVEQYTLADVPRLAEQSASLYATTPQEKMSFFSYYQNYYKKQITEGNPVSLPVNSAAGLATAQAAVASSKAGTPLTSTSSGIVDPPDGTGTVTYPTPDTSQYQFDPSSGFYYDPFTKLYYDANSQYYYNSQLNKYLYWDGIRMTYLPTPASAALPEMSPANQLGSDTNSVIVGAPQPAAKGAKKKEKDNDVDRVKVAKRIAKDMEKWAKTLNQKKESARSSVAPVVAPAGANPATTSKFGSPAGAADIGFAVLERKDHLSTLGNYYDSVARRNEVSSSVLLPPPAESDEEDEASEDKSHTDWTRLICLLCKRQLGSREALVKHQQISDLHKQNLAAWYRSKGLDPDDAQIRQNQYRDRASERRQKCGVPDTPRPSRLKESYIKAREAVFEQPTSQTPRAIGSENKGNKLLQKMGWQQGMGLGKTNQGRTNIIEASRRTASAGLGSRGATGGVTPGPGETYKDCVKKMMAVRYAQLEGD